MRIISTKNYTMLLQMLFAVGKTTFTSYCFDRQKVLFNLMMHSFAPKNSIFSFFDLCYNIFKKIWILDLRVMTNGFLRIVAAQMKTVFSGGYREDKKVSIGSSAYSIKIGLRSFSLNEDLSADFVKFIKDTFYRINKLFNREPINENHKIRTIHCRMVEK